MTMERVPPVLAVIIPCHNEELMLPGSCMIIEQKIRELVSAKMISEKSFVCFVDDGSNDNTWSLIEKFSESGIIKGIKLSANFGHQNALLAGLLSQREHADCFLTIDADMQDDVDVIGEMAGRYIEGNMIVYGVRDDRRTDSFIKRNTARLFYAIMKCMGIRSIDNHADFRLIDRRVVECLGEYREVNLFLRGLFPLMGFKSEIVKYTRQRRAAGRSKYPVKKMASFAWQGITSFNTSLLRVVTIAGVIMFVLAVITAIWALITWFNGKSIQGWTSILLVISVFSGINMISLGLIGEYVGKIYLEVKQRPRYIIEKTIP